MKTRHFTSIERRTPLLKFCILLISIGSLFLISSCGTTTRNSSSGTGERTSYTSKSSSNESQNVISEDVSLTPEKFPNAYTRPYSDYDFSSIDRHALDAPDRLKSSPRKLAEYLAEPAGNDVEVARAIYRWVIENIRYDTESFFSGNLTSVEPSQVLQEGKAVCSGYSGVYKMLAKHAGLEVVTISGFGKGYGYRDGDKIEGTNHAWNAVKLDGEWHLLDSTWGAGGYSNRKGKWVRKFDDSYFLTPPAAFAFSHRPQDQKWQLLKEPLTRQEFQQFPNLEPSFFEMGFSPQKTRSLLEDDADMKFPEVFTFADDVDVYLRQAPVQGELSSKRRYKFVIESGEIARAAFVNNGSFTFMKPDSSGSTYQGEIQPNSGTVGVYVLPKDAENKERFSAVLEYEVE